MRLWIFVDGYPTFFGNILEEEELAKDDSYLESLQVEGVRKSEEQKEGKEKSQNKTNSLAKFFKLVTKFCSLILFKL